MEQVDQGHAEDALPESGTELQAKNRRLSQMGVLGCSGVRGRVASLGRQPALLERCVGAPAPPAPPGRNRTGEWPTAPLPFQAITHRTAQVYLRASDFLPLHKTNFPVIAE